MILKKVIGFNSIKLIEYIGSIVRTKLVALFWGVSGVYYLSLFYKIINLLVINLLAGIKTNFIQTTSLSDLSKDERFHNSREFWFYSLLTYFFGFAAFVVLSNLNILSYEIEVFHFVFLFISGILYLFYFISLNLLRVLQLKTSLKALLLLNSISAALVYACLVRIHFFSEISRILFAMNISFLLSAFIALYLLPSHFRRIFLFPKIFFKDYLSVLFISSKYTVPIILNGLISIFQLYFLKVFFSTEFAGFVVAALTLTNTVVSILVSETSLITYPKLISLSYSRRLLNEFIQSDIRPKMHLAFFSSVLLFFFGDQLVDITYSADFGLTKKYLKFISLSAFYSILNNYFAYIFLSLAKDKVYFLFEYISVFTTLSLFLFFALLAPQEYISLCFFLAQFIVTFIGVMLLKKQKIKIFTKREWFVFFGLSIFVLCLFFLSI